MVSVVIPALNEAPTIAGVVALARRDPLVHEVIVVDDGSIDGTPAAAASAGARVLTSTLLGKGASMLDGLRAAACEVVVFLDGDLIELAPDVVSRLALPVVVGEADLAKARFTRAAGRVTMLTAKPLLRTFFPEVAHLEQPLGGLLAARRSVLARLPFETDYAVDLGLVLDAVAAGARLVEVDVGHLEHPSQDLRALSEMARQVVRVILDRASRHGRLHIGQIHAIAEAERQVQAELGRLVDRLGRVEKLALFDMDGTLLAGRFIVALAERTGRHADLERYLDRAELEAEDRARRIAALFAGVPKQVFEEVARELPLMPGAVEAVRALRQQGFRVGIVTDSFRIVAELVRRRVFADFSIAHVMTFRGERATGSLRIHPSMRHPGGCRRHSCCKLNVLLHLSERLGVAAEHFLVVGDGENDICMLEAAGVSVAFRPKTELVAAAAQHTVEANLGEVAELVEEAFTHR